VSEIRAVPVDTVHAPGLVALFERTGSPCFCRWWHFSGDKNAWLERCAKRPNESRDELAAALAKNSDEARGVVALDADDQVVGWMKLSPASTVQKLFEQRLYKGLPCLNDDRSGVWVVGCCLIDEAWRRRGVAGVLLDAGLALARSSGASSVEAFPRRAEDVPSEQLWTGPFELFARRGFQVVNDFAPYPVLRFDFATESRA
jgi:GNAT superfamily N-acetyltransferase